MGTVIFELEPFNADHFEQRPAVGTTINKLPHRSLVTTLGWREGALERFLSHPAHAQHFAQLLGLPWAGKILDTDHQRGTIVLRQLADIDLVLVTPGQRALLVELKAEGGDGLSDAAAQLARNFDRAERIVRNAFGPETALEPVLVGPWHSGAMERVRSTRAWSRLREAAGRPPRVVAFRALRDEGEHRYLVLVEGEESYTALKQAVESWKRGDPPGSFEVVAQRLERIDKLKRAGSQSEEKRGERAYRWSYEGGETWKGLDLDIAMLEQRVLVSLSVDSKFRDKHLGAKAEAPLSPQVRALREAVRAADQAAGFAHQDELGQRLRTLFWSRGTLSVGTVTAA